MTAPNICWGDLAVDRQEVRWGYWDFIKRIQPGQQEVNIGRSFSSPLVKRLINSVLSSMIVRSAENTVSNA